MPGSKAIAALTCALLSLFSKLRAELATEKLAVTKSPKLTLPQP
jgi:hypothetical protein